MTPTAETLKHVEQQRSNGHSGKLQKSITIAHWRQNVVKEMAADRSASPVFYGIFIEFWDFDKAGARSVTLGDRAIAVKRTITRYRYYQRNPRSIERMGTVRLPCGISRVPWVGEQKHFKMSLSAF